MCHMHRASVSGKKFFHRRCISWSYRNRGYDARIHKNSDVSSSVLIMKLAVNSSGSSELWAEPRNTTVVKAFIMMMFMYSAMKNSANGPAAYSTLKPDTSSDSPSVRSNGARLVSARVEINHIIASGHVVSSSHRGSCVMIRDCSENEPLINSTDRRIIAMVTS